MSADLIPFLKYHGLGNDFVVIDALAQARWSDAAWERLAVRMCDRHTGIGADGVLVVTRASGADAAMRIVNSDGSDGGMCGNGVRCVARLLFERHGRGPGLRVAVGERVLQVVCNVEDGRFRSATVDMGVPEQCASIGPEAMEAGLVSDCDAAAPGWRAAAGVEPWFVRVAIPNPHAVFFCADAAAVPLREVGPLIERHRAFPNRTNVQFVQVVDPARAIVRTWERGAGPTLACGTGACAAAVAGAVTGRVSREASVVLPGGTLHVRLCNATNRVFMTGAACHVFDGECLLTIE